jgi:hypothetical protein
MSVIPQCHIVETDSEESLNAQCAQKRVGSANRQDQAERAKCLQWIKRFVYRCANFQASLHL